MSGHRGFMRKLTFRNVMVAGAAMLLAGPLTGYGQNSASADTTVEALPLKRGYYVRSGTPCNRASRADVFSLVTRKGMNLNCTFKKIEKTGATTYRVTQECSSSGAAWGRPDEIETSTDTYEIPNETSYNVTYDGGYQASARYCAQSSMSPEYRSNDISDLIK
ncbi:hypothetical protein AKL17_2p0020 (plasmid) [Frigidibacter mobilis]|uniref:DUF3617 family protein n=2 Tax=Frigidibacter mobilis TaxID=1335048 RepID=A0A159Z9A1_9RHOB|nr:hypothetical protein AKL17_1365 [Frigidibacter mobilis]AMY72142.1 hypothetical protein AKL17_2p0020 [Frigidibacter mobilis]